MKTYILTQCHKFKLHTSYTQQGNNDKVFHLHVCSENVYADTTAFNQHLVTLAVCFFQQFMGEVCSSDTR